MKANDFNRNNIFASSAIIMDHQFFRSTPYNIFIPKCNTTTVSEPTMLLNSNFHITAADCLNNGRKINTLLDRMSSVQEKTYQTMSTSLPTASSSSTKNPKFQFFSGLLTNFFNTFSIYNRNKTISNSNMFHSAPNIYFDMIANKLEFPNNKENEKDAIFKDTIHQEDELNYNCEKINSSSFTKDSSSVVVVPVPDIDSEDKNRKRTKSILKYCPETSMKSEKKTFPSCFNPNVFIKNKILNKNRKEKDRNAICFDINDDMKQYDSDSDIEIIDENDIYVSLSNNSINNKYQKDNSDEKNIAKLDFENFPMLPSPQCILIKDENRRNMRQRHISECDSEDSFVVFSDDASKTTPSHKNSNSLAKLLLCRRRQVSECSEDSIVFEYDDTTLVDENSEFDYSDESDQDEEKVQFESGFEEKKVRFNLKPDVHVMRMWDYAYRQARIGKWEEAARDRERFKTRIATIEKTLASIFDKKLRDRIFKERFLTNEDC